MHTKYKHIYEHLYREIEGGGRGSGGGGGDTETGKEGRSLGANLIHNLKATGSSTSRDD